MKIVRGREGKPSERRTDTFTGEVWGDAGHCRSLLHQWRDSTCKPARAADSAKWWRKCALPICHGAAPPRPASR